MAWRELKEQIDILAQYSVEESMEGLWAQMPDSIRELIKMDILESENNTVSNALWEELMGETYEG